ncbi:ABC transporter ATP-binding protein [Desulfosporosinus youngiae]|uniref:ABC-type multidrug transport system, ATPase component n=1 Tax=Desulfosporosinus youngiae DSM 17734 TaxID=768710 RepID=H5XXF4_9FIRM|nr:ABC transporter ATP-binding protein [Desulfosporosinus youngiae]EHQ91160.1 ABC-type multidrug transport system, ATPase component [Desulfosporosinus youngiae DSM 17734]
MELLKVDIKHAGYSDNRDVIKNVALSVKSGELVGLIGPNGAGKSTTIKAIIGLLPVMDGKVEFAGKRKSYAYIPEQPVLYEGLTLWEHLELAAAAYEIQRNVFVPRAEELLKLFHLTEVKHHLPGTFSKGMQQKVMLIVAFLLEPWVFVVDEPFMGLDPRGMGDFLAYLNQARAKGAGVLMCTHILDTAERICSSFVLMNAGTVVTRGDLKEIRKQCRLPEGSLGECFEKLLENR